MADSVYISEHLTKPQLEFLKLLDDYEIQLFKFSEIEQLLKQKQLDRNSPLTFVFVVINFLMQCSMPITRWLGSYKRIGRRKDGTPDLT